jgi:hypothetical protein
MGELNQNWGSPWRALQTLLANQFGVVHAGELYEPDANDHGAIDDSWIKRAHQRQFRTFPPRQ